MIRINKLLASQLGIGRRQADKLIASGVVLINGLQATPGQMASQKDTITVDNQPLNIEPTKLSTTIIMHKPVGYVCSRLNQGSSPTVYELLPPELRRLHYIGRLDKDSSGLLLLTDDGQLTYQLTHPRFEKEKVYQVSLDKPLKEADKMSITLGVQLEDGPSALGLSSPTNDNTSWTVTMHEGRNRQIRRTFAARGYNVIKLHRLQFGDYKLGQITAGNYQRLPARS